jgi:hypothetical protein
MTMADASGSLLTEDVPLDHVRLILVSEKQLYLDIPLNTITSLCLKPRKYLLFLGWCILGVEGELQGETVGLPLERDGELDNHGIYHYVIPGDTGGFSLVIVSSATKH